MDDIPAPQPAKPERFIDCLRAFMRARQLAYRTDKTYCIWILDFIRFHIKQRPETLGTLQLEHRMAEPLSQ